MSIVAAIRGMLAKGMSVEHALEVAEAFERQEDRRSPAAKRQARYREKKRGEGVTERNESVTDPTVTCYVTSVTDHNVLRNDVTPLARVDDNLLTLELSGCISKDKEHVNERNGTKQALLAFGEAWNGLASEFSLPQIDEIKTGSTRERHALARLRELGGHDDLLTHIRGSPYLLGEVNGFRCTFDWIINVSNCQKIMEGNYEGRNEKHKDDWRHAHR